MPSPPPRTYRAGTLKEALSRVRRDLGGSAVILGMREVRRKRLLGLGEQDLIEVTAARPGGQVRADRPQWERVSTSTRQGLSDSLGSAITPPAAARPSSLAATPGPPPVTMPSLGKKAHEPAADHRRPALNDRLERLRETVDDLSKRGSIDHLVIDIPSWLAPSYACLLDADVPEFLARRLVRCVADTIEPDEAHLPGAIDDALRHALALCLPIAPPIGKPLPGVRRVVALVGPTGVGKTTTVAKLAANAKVALGLRVGLATVDTFRIAAVEQIRTYAEIIDLPLAVADSPDRLPIALDSLGPIDLALIDTAGRSPRDEVSVRELANFLSAARPDEIHLVLSAASGEKNLRAVVERFAPLGFDRLILSKVDEADALGPILGVVSRTGRPISYLTTGQAVPDDIEPADRDRLASLILGTEATP